jgi:hypothetical protein
VSDERERRGDPDPDSLRSALPGLARVGAGVYLRSAGWALGTSLRATRRLAEAAASGESAAQLAGDVRKGVRQAARELVGLTEIEERLRQVVPDQVLPDREPGADGRPPPSPTADLREQGTKLLRQSADVSYDESAHPAYARILGELAPDEARILRMLALEGPQPAVDVRTAKALINSELVAPGLSMIGEQAGCRYLDRVPAYLNNLYRLGLIWFSRESLDPHRYQVLEAQPDVLAALHSGGRGKTVRRSVHLTPFGEDFCRICLPLAASDVEAIAGPPPGAGAEPVDAPRPHTPPPDQPMHTAREGT